GAQVPHVFRRAGAQVIDRRDTVAVAQEGLGQVRADETGPASDECVHKKLLSGEAAHRVWGMLCWPQSAITRSAASIRAGMAMTTASTCSRRTTWGNSWMVPRTGRPPTYRSQIETSSSRKPTAKRGDAPR